MQKTITNLSKDIALALRDSCLFDGAADTSESSWAVKESAKIIEEYIKEYLEQN